MSKTTTIAFSVLAVGLLALAGFGTMAAAKPGEDSDDGADHSGRGSGKGHDGNRSAERDNRSAEHDAAQQAHAEQRDARKGEMRAAHDAWQECKRDHRDSNESLNESMQEHCMGEKSFFLNATHARREGRALLSSIAGLERLIGRLEVREERLEDRLAAGNLSANETEHLEARLAKIEGHQDRMVDRLADKQERLEALHARWHSVRDEVADRRHGHDDDAEPEESDGSSSASDSSSAAAA